MAAPNARRVLTSFLQTSLDGYYAEPNGDMSFAHKPPDDAEWNEFVSGNVLGAGKALFAGLSRRLGWALTNCRTFANGSVVLWWQANI